MKSMGISEFKARCIAVLKEVEETRTPLLVTRRGRPVARIEPVAKSVRLGALQHLGQIRVDLLATDFSGEWELESAARSSAASSQGTSENNP